MGNTLTMETRQEPRFVKFTTGECVEGTLVSIERMTIKDRPALRYTVLESDGELVSFLGAFQINTKLRATDRGHHISVRCEGEDVMVKRGENCMKVFEVRVSKEKVSQGAASSVDPLEITDDDIPF